MFADLSASFDWTAIAIAALTLVLSGIGWAGKRFSGKLDKHMDKVEGFMGDTREHKAVVNVRLDNVERQVSVSRHVNETHQMVKEMHERGCGPVVDLEGRR